MSQEPVELIRVHDNRRSSNVWCFTGVLLRIPETKSAASQMYWLLFCLTNFQNMVKNILNAAQGQRERERERERESESERE